MYLSKSKYCSLWQCAKQLWLDANHPELQAEDSSREDRMTTGNEVGDLAMGLFGDYVGMTSASVYYSVNEAEAAQYAAENGITVGYVLGGEKLVTDEIVRSIFAMDAESEIIVKN